ncbi:MULTISPECIES: DUF5047 domain-containing protein [unclassified Streptomyces]|uniref:DUF5047 domain-containing protein n=1 Tax=unclassified Streptomyces TaxID=2593676 RepID=UPI0033C5C62F
MDAYYNGALTAADIPIADGMVTLDRGSKIRRSLALTVADVKYLPWTASDPLAVYGQTLVVSQGIPLGNTTEMVTLGTFRVDEPQGDTLTGPVTLTGKSSEVAIQDDRFIVPTSTRGYATCIDAITYLIRQTLPSAVIVNATSDGRNPACAVATWDTQGDRWDAVVQIATSMSAEVYVDALDRFVIADQPNVNTASVVWEIRDGEGGTLINAARQMSRTGVYNAVVASGQNMAANTAPVSAVAYDTDPTSPTRWGGPYGHVPRYYSSALLTTTGACLSAATYMLADAIAPNIQTTITAAPNPALEAGDCVRVTDGGRKQLFTLQSVGIPLTSQGSSSITLRGGKAES